MNKAAQPFRRVHAVMAIIGAILQQHGHGANGMSLARMEAAKYTSRGHGGKRARHPTGIAACKRAARKARNVRRHRAACRA